MNVAFIRRVRFPERADLDGAEILTEAALERR